MCDPKQTSCCEIDRDCIHGSLFPHAHHGEFILSLSSASEGACMQCVCSWFDGWLLGMHHCNVNVWWSRATMAWCWGQCINGIAACGRDPTLTCACAFASTSDGICSCLSCFVENCNEQRNQTNDDTGLPLPRIKPPDWWTCTVPVGGNAPWSQA